MWRHQWRKGLSGCPSSQQPQMSRRERVRGHSSIHSPYWQRAPWKPRGQRHGWAEPGAQWPPLKQKPALHRAVGGGEKASEEGQQPGGSPSPPARTQRPWGPSPKSPHKASPGAGQDPGPHHTQQSPDHLLNPEPLNLGRGRGVSQAGSPDPATRSGSSSVLSQVMHWPPPTRACNLPNIFWRRRGRSQGQPPAEREAAGLPEDPLLSKGTGTPRKPPPPPAAGEGGGCTRRH